MIETLAALWLSEFQARRQYESERAARFVAGYSKLAADSADRYADEARHAEALAARIVYLGGALPLDPGPAATIPSDASIPAQVDADIALEQVAIRAYQSAIAEAEQAGDFGTREILAGILADEEEHERELRAQARQIVDMTVQNFLSVMV